MQSGVIANWTMVCSSACVSRPQFKWPNPWGSGIFLYNFTQLGFCPHSFSKPSVHCNEKLLLCPQLYSCAVVLPPELAREGVSLLPALFVLKDLWKIKDFWKTHNTQAGLLFHLSHWLQYCWITIVAQFNVTQAVVLIILRQKYCSQSTSTGASPNGLKQELCSWLCHQTVQSFVVGQNLTDTLAQA